MTGGTGDVTAGIPVGLHGRSRARTVTEGEMTVLASMTGAITPVHTDRVFARGTPFGDLTLGGPLIVAYVVGLWRTNPLKRRLASAYGVETITGVGHEVAYRSPVLAGDLLVVDTTLTALRATASDPSRGILTFHDVARNQRDQVVLELDRLMLFHRPGGLTRPTRGAPERRSANERDGG